VIYLDLLIGFLEVGFFSFGGGYAAIPLIRDVVLNHGWLNDEMITYMIAVSESTPGPIMVNMATYVGSIKGGTPGALIATTAVVLPAFIIIILAMALLKAFIRNNYVKAVMSGLKPCILGIILSTGLFMIAENVGIAAGGPVDILTLCLTCGLALLYFGSRIIKKKGVSPIVLIIISAVLGVILGQGDVSPCPILALI